MSVILIIILVLLAIIVIGGLVLVGIGKHLFEQFFPGKTVKQVVAERDYEEQNVQKSVSSMTKMYLPRIAKDFPEFSWEEWKSNIENVISSYLYAISKKDASILSEFAGYNIQQKVQNIISNDTAAGIEKNYADVKVYTTEIKRYSLEKGLVHIKMESAVSHFVWHTRNGKVVYGAENKRKQTKYTTVLTYIQDYDMVMHSYSGDTSIVLTCPNCGAPIKNLGQKYCDYCGTGIVEVSTKIWRVTDIDEMKNM